MKRSIYILIACILLFSCFSAAAEGFSSPLPPLNEVTGAEDIGDARAVLFDVDSGAVYYESGGDKKARPGSLTTIMTAVLLIENTPVGQWDTPLEPLASVNSNWSSRGFQMGLKKDMTPTRLDLLYGLLLEGAADAAFVTELIVSGSEADFVNAMNEKAEELGMSSTRFDNGFGLGSGGHYTCAQDMAKLASFAMRDALFCRVAAAKEYVCSEGCGSIALKNSNAALSSPDCIGIKAGADSEKEHCVITCVRSGELRLAAVVLEASSDSAAYGIAERLISSGMGVYSSECAGKPFLPTDALFKANKETALRLSPGGELVRTSVGAGDVLRVCGSSISLGKIWYCIFREGTRLWISADDADLVSYVDDVLIYPGMALSRETAKGESIRIDPIVITRHDIVDVKLTLSLPRGDVALYSEHHPNVFGHCELKNTSLAEPFETALLSEGIYLCTIEATVRACALGCEPELITKTERSLLSIGTGGECISYNSNGGSGAPAGECFIGSFTIPEETPSRTGCVFLNWNSASDGSGQSFAPGETVTADGSFTLYAMWAPGEDAWDADLRALYDEGVILEGYVKNEAGITSLYIEISGAEGVVYTNSAALRANDAEPGSLLLDPPVVLEPGQYSVKLYGCAAGGERTPLFEDGLTVEAPEATPAPEITQEPSPTEQIRPSKPFIDLASVPIWVWFAIGAAVVIILIAIIIHILRHG